MFPEKLPLKEGVYTARKARSASITKIALYGIFARLVIAVAELCGYFVFNSSVLLLDALSTFADITSSVLLIASIKLAERPPDEEHPFGHGRYEPLAGLQLGIFLSLGGIGMFSQQFLSFFHKEPLEPLNPLAFLLPLFAVVILELSFRRMIATAKQEKSPALEAEAYHFRIDGLNTAFAFIALGLAALFPAWGWILDKVGAMSIALFMVFVGAFAAKRNLNQLLDHVPEKECFSLVQTAAETVDGVRGTEKIRIQQYGPDAHVDIDVEVDPYLTVDEAHRISQLVRKNIQEEWPQVREVVVHIEPYFPGDHNKSL